MSSKTSAQKDAAALKPRSDIQSITPSEKLPLELRLHVTASGPMSQDKGYCRFSPHFADPVQAPGYSQELHERALHGHATPRPAAVLDHLFGG
jgi:hypothetical protein